MVKLKTSFIIQVICILSFFLYFLAPYGTDFLYCSVVAFLYLIEAFFICRLDWANKFYMSFNLLFAVSFFLTSFGFALLVQDSTAETLSVLAGRTVDLNLLPKCCSLCLIAYSMYSLFFLKTIKRVSYIQQDVIKLPPLGETIAIPLFYLSFFALFVKTYVFFIATGDINLNEDTFLISLFQCMLPVALIINIAKKKCSGLFDFIKNNIIILLPTVVLMLLFLIMGDRGLIIVCASTIIMVYILLVKRIKIKTLGFLFVIGVLLMFIIRQTRIGDSALSSGSFSSFAEASSNAFKEADGITALFADLTGAVQELCLGYQYEQKYGMMAPVEQLIMLPTYPFPLVPSFVASVFFDKIPSDYGTGERINAFVSDVGEGHFGNHVVIDIYMRWGFLGVIIAFSLFGFFIAKISNGIKKNIGYLAIYLVLTGLAIYTPRNTIPYLIRPIAYSYFFIWLLTHKRVLKLVVSDKK